VFWDEPVKAAFLRLLNEHWPEAVLVAGVHDTDYFAKTSAHIATDDAFCIIEHNDGGYRDLWSAAGEISALFGSEDVPTRAMFERHGVPFNPLASRYPAEAADCADALIELITWAFETSLKSIPPPDQERAKAYRDDILELVNRSAHQCCKGASLTDLFKKVLTHFYDALLGSDYHGLDIANSMSLFEFNTQTCNRPRFKILDCFLNESTQADCLNAYNTTVKGGGAYSLDQFGEAALPFDVVLSGVGRATLRVSGRQIDLDWYDHSDSWQTDEPIVSTTALAKALEAHFGDHCVVIGKAITLVDMLAAEFMVVFHETASGYTPRSVAMNQLIRKAGIALDLKPIVRLSYSTWSALADANVSAEILLPEHVAQESAEWRKPIPASEFGRQWKNIVEAHTKKLRKLSSLRKPKELLAYLASQDEYGDHWTKAQEKYIQNHVILSANAALCRQNKQAIRDLKSQIEDNIERRIDTERAKGDEFRSILAPLLEKIKLDNTSKVLHDEITLERARRTRMFDSIINDCRAGILKARRQIRKLRAECRLIERNEEANAARREIVEIVYSAQQERMDRIRDAYLSINTLTHTNVRPSAWWLPLIDPSGEWFTAISESVKVTIEEM
jgi:hypothetical protein